MAGVKALRRIQIGAEVTAGTPVAATARWRGTGVIEDARETVFPEEDVAILPGTDRNYCPKHFGKLSFDSTPLTFEQLYPFAGGIAASGSVGAADGGGTGKVYTYTLSKTTQNTPKSYTFEGGDNQQAEQMDYGTCESFSLSGKAGEAVMLSCDWFGQTVGSMAAFTAASAAALPVPPNFEEVLFGKGKLYIDTVSGSQGTTQATNTWLGFDLNVTTGMVPVFTGDGNLVFSFVKDVGAQADLSITFEHDSTATTQKDRWRAGTTQYLRMTFQGSALTTSATYTYKTFNIDACAVIESVEKLGEQDGNDTVNVKYKIRENTTADKFLEIVAVNQIASLP